MKTKRILGILTLVILVVTLAACGGKTECDFCGEEKKCTTKDFLGEKMSICDDCMDDFNDF